MTGSSAKPGLPTDNEHGTVFGEQPSDAASAAPRRRPYQAPKLRHLGSVRELTLGSTAGMPEGGGTFMTVM